MTYIFLYVHLINDGADYITENKHKAQIKFSKYILLLRQAVGHIVNNAVVISLPSIKTSSGYSYNEPAGIAWFGVRLWHTSSISGSVSVIGRFRSEDTHFPKSSCNILSMMFSNSANWEPRCLQGYRQER